MKALTALIITHNEAANIARTITSVQAIATEVLVIDSGSTDDTPELARSAGARVIETHWRGFGQQKNFGAQQAKHDWILSLDADEVPDPQLLQAIANADAGARTVYGMRRITNFCGTWVRHGAWRKDIVWRLYHRQTAHWDKRPVHETLLSEQPRASLPGELLHYSYPDLASHERKCAPYARLGAESLYAAGQRATWSKLYIAPLWRAFRSYILLSGWRDGWAGRELARRDAALVRKKYRLLAELWRNDPTS